MHCHRNSSRSSRCLRWAFTPAAPGLLWFRLQKSSLQARVLRDCEIPLFLGQKCVISNVTEVTVSERMAQRKQGLNQWTQDEMKAQQTLPRFHLGITSDHFFGRKCKHVSQNRSTSVLSLTSHPAPGAGAHPHERVLNLSTKGCLMWSAAFRKRSRPHPHCKNFWPLFAAGPFPTTLSPWLGFKGRCAALPFNILTSHAAWTGRGSCTFFLHYLSVHASCFVSVSADGRGSMDWSLQDAPDQFSSHVKYELLTAARHAEPIHSPKAFPPNFPHVLQKFYTN